SVGNNLQLTDSTIEEKDNINKINEFLILTSNSF
ncbi:DsbC family protein, partial [Francisella tularensis subsp. holarctica]|nr:DsbC family protein [Francisella tularensis subsp. holarctica]